MDSQLSLFPAPKQEFSETRSTSGLHRKLLNPNRTQIEIRVSSLNDLIPEDHTARVVWNYIDKLDISKSLKNIITCHGCVGRPAVNPKILIALWLYATIEGIGSARVLTRYTKEHIGFTWICGGVQIERKTISDFRVNNNDLFDELLAQGVAILVKAKAVTLKEIAQDGLKVRSDSSKNSFRNTDNLKHCYEKAKERIDLLKKEIDEDPASCSRRQKHNKIRAQEEVMSRIQKAEEELKEFISDTDKNRQKHRKKKLTNDEKEYIKSSITDPEARIMKMPDGSYHPAYNFQYSVDTENNIIISLDVIQNGSDAGQMLPMYEKIKATYNQIPGRYLVDCGFKNYSDIKKIFKDGCKVYMPPQQSGKRNVISPEKSRAKNSEPIKEWRARMEEKETKNIYKNRKQTIELANAKLRGLGLYRLAVRGLEKAKGIATFFAFAYNMMRTRSLGIA